MGTFSVRFEIGDIEGRQWETTMGMVDTGSTFTWVPSSLLERLGIPSEGRWEFETANGRVIQRDMAQARVRLDGQQRITIVIFGQEGDSVLLGAYTLEGFLLAPDPVNRRLVRVRGLAMGTVLSGGTGWSAGRPMPRTSTSSLASGDVAQLHALVRGRVQGVYYRGFVSTHAQRLGVA